MMKRLSGIARAYLIAVTAFVGMVTTGIGIWCVLDPPSFARAVGFVEHQHFLHDVGAFQIGLGITLLLALIWADALAVALAGFIVANTVHTVNHLMDLDLGGRPPSVADPQVGSASSAFCRRATDDPTPSSVASLAVRCGSAATSGSSSLVVENVTCASVATRTTSPAASM